MADKKSKKIEKEVPPINESKKNVLTREALIASATIPCPTCGGSKCAECLWTGKVLDKNESLDKTVKKRLCE